MRQAARTSDAPTITEAEERISVAPQWQLMWWRFRKHKLALVSTALVICFYLVVAFADFLAYADPQASEAQRSLIAPQSGASAGRGPPESVRGRSGRRARSRHLQARLCARPE